MIACKAETASTIISEIANLGTKKQNWDKQDKVYWEQVYLQSDWGRKWKWWWKAGSGNKWQSGMPCELWVLILQDHKLNLLFWLHHHVRQEDPMVSISLAIRGTLNGWIKHSGTVSVPILGGTGVKSSFPNIVVGWVHSGWQWHQEIMLCRRKITFQRTDLFRDMNKAQLVGTPLEVKHFQLFWKWLPLSLAISKKLYPSQQNSYEGLWIQKVSVACLSSTEAEEAN